MTPSPHTRTAVARPASASYPMTAHKEKLTIVAPLTVRLTQSLSDALGKLADLHRMERSQFVRHLILAEKERQREIWQARHSLFGEGSVDASNAACDDVLLNQLDMDSE